MTIKGKSIAGRLRAAIRQAERGGLTRYRLAQLSGVAESQISRIARGIIDPKLGTCERIAAAIGYRLDLTPAPGRTPRNACKRTR
jgi:transcriptional regulator with XRE-family HTH domain